MGHFRPAGTLLPLVLFWQTEALSLQRSADVPSNGKSRNCPSLFAAVVSSLDNSKRRNEIRAMWTTAGENYDSSIEYKYALCTRGGITEELQREQNEHGDLMFMDCEEGYLNGILTRKVAESMREYLKDFSHLDLYMKIDDDTFISTDKLCDFFDTKSKKGLNLHQSYFGVFYEGNEHMTQMHPVIRDKESPWFEPYSKYAEERYPISAKGGPGYILPKAVVASIINDGIDTKYELNNEDKAVGYWVKIYQKQSAWVNHNKTHITYVNIPGTDGYEEHEQWIKKKGPWKKYPHILHHHLDGTSIDCLHKIEFNKDPEELIGPCFTQNLFAKRELEHIRIHMPSSF